MTHSNQCRPLSTCFPWMLFNNTHPNANKITISDDSLNSDHCPVPFFRIYSSISWCHFFRCHYQAGAFFRYHYFRAPAACVVLQESFIIPKIKQFCNTKNVIEENDIFAFLKKMAALQKHILILQNVFIFGLLLVYFLYIL